MSAYWKIPLQVLVLLVGVFVFVFYVFTPAADAVQRGARAGAARGAERRRITRHSRAEFAAAFEAATGGGRAIWRRRDAGGDPSRLAAAREAVSRARSGRSNPCEARR